MKLVASVIGAFLGFGVFQPGATAGNADSLNYENFVEIRDLLFETDAKPGAELLQENGRTPQNQKCQVKQSLGVSDVRLTLTREKDLDLTFAVSWDADISTQFEITDSDEGMIEAEQVYLASLDGSRGANRQTLKVITNERQGWDKNILYVKITQQHTDSWKSVKGRQVPDFSNSRKVVGECSFNSN